MKLHSNAFKEQISLQGRELDCLITYKINNVEQVLISEDINSIFYGYEGSILKSVMKELIIDSNIDIPKKTIINYKFGIKVNGVYEYIDYGNYIVFSSNKKEDTNSYEIKCYDKLLYSMVDYEKLDISYPISIRDYLIAICEKLGIEFADSNTKFANYDKIIPSELYLDSNGDSLGYTFRDVLDELSQVTASNICINNDDKLEVRYITDTNDEIDKTFLKDTNVNFEKKYGPINSIVLSRSAESDNVCLKDDESISKNGICEIKIIDNQIMNFNNRNIYLQDIYNKLNGLTFWLNNLSSTGICYYDLCDRYNIKIDDKIYSCIMFSDEININQGLSEEIYTDEPQVTQTDYTKTDKTDKKISLIVDKQNKKINALVEVVDESKEQVSNLSLEVDKINSSVSSVEKKVEKVEQSVPKYQVELDIYNITIPVDSSNKPLENKDYFINYKTTYEGEEINSNVSSESNNPGITFGLSNNQIVLSVLTSIAITNLTNEFVIDFSYTNEDEIYKISKKVIVNLNVLVDEEINSLQEQINDTNKDLNNNYTNNQELDQKLEEQKQTITEEYSTLISQTKESWQASVINYINQNGVEKFVNTLVTIDIDGLKLSKSDEDIVSLLNNKGLYVSDGKLREDLSNLLMKVDRSGALFKLLEVLGTIKEQEIIQKEKIIDATYGECQAWYWIGE